MSKSRMVSVVLAAAAVFALSLALPDSAGAQIRASERSSVSQVIDGTSIMIEYGRPRLRRRTVDEIFGTEVTWGEVWTPGANQSTTITLSKDVSINGTEVAAGKYSVWMVVQNEDHWNTVLIADTTLFHLPHPTVMQEMTQFMSPVSMVDRVEELTWSFDKVGSTGVTATMAWADRSVPLEIKVKPSLPIELAAEKAAPFLGRYTVTWADGPTPDGWGETAELFHADDALRMRWDIWFWPGMEEQILVPLTDEWFTFGIAIDGEIFDVIREFTYEFTVENGKATGFEVRLPDDSVLFRGVRAD